MNSVSSINRAPCQCLIREGLKNGLSATYGTNESTLCYCNFTEKDKMYCGVDVSFPIRKQVDVTAIKLGVTPVNVINTNQIMLLN